MNVAGIKAGVGSQSRLERRTSLNSLQAGRAVAALLVCAFHLTILFKAATNASVGPFQSLTWWGFRGVDFFFVLSGFIILFAHQRDIDRPERAFSYVAKRVSRVYPVYWLYTGILLTVSAVGSGALIAPLKSPGAFASSLLLIHFSPAEPPIAAAWTLFHEVIFYAVFATLIVSRRAGQVVLAGWLVAIVLFQTWPTPHTIPGTVFSIFNLNFFFGMLAFLVHRRARPGLARMLVCAGLVGLLSLLIVDARMGGSATVQVGFAAAFASIIAGCAALERSGREWRIRPLVILGDASYSLYLIHTSVQTYLLKALLLLPIFPGLPVWIVYLLVFVATVTLAVLAHVVAERPLTRLTRDWLKARPSQVRQAG